MDLKKLKFQILKNKAEIDRELRRDLAFQIGRQIERARILRKMTQKELAEKIGTHQSGIARGEAGNSLPSLSFLKKIADALDTYLIAPKFAFVEESSSKVLGIKLDQATQKNYTLQPTTSPYFKLKSGASAETSRKAVSEEFVKN